MEFQLEDTIGALGSAPGPSGRGIVRVSGPHARSCVAAVFDPIDRSVWNDARFASAHPGTLRLPSTRSPLPVCVYLWPLARSYTGQPLAEIHAPGSPPLLEAVLSQMLERGVRPALPGEFTLRAFLSGRIDLVQAEAVLGVIDSAHDADLTTALRQLAGGISGRLARLRNDLLDLLADLEAGLDFADEDLEFVTREHVCRRVAAGEAAFSELIAQCDTRACSAGRRSIVLSGLSNAGKSTLFNALLGRRAALVSDLAGTTRDYLRGESGWHGVAIELIDTPGYDTHRDEIERHAQDLRRDQMERADLIVWCSAWDVGAESALLDREMLSSLRRRGRPVVLACTKSDLGCGAQPADAVAVSAFDGRGLPELIAACVGAIAASRSRSGELLGTTAARCRESLVHGRQSLHRAQRAAETHAGDELIALETRDALDHLGRILGTVYTDDVLDRVFSRFCIGK